MSMTLRELPARPAPSRRCSTSRPRRRRPARGRRLCPSAPDRTAGRCTRRWCIRAPRASRALGAPCCGSTSAASGEAPARFDGGAGEKDDFRAALDFMAAKVSGHCRCGPPASRSDRGSRSKSARPTIRASRSLIGIAPPVATLYDFATSAERARSRSSSFRASATRSVRSRTCGSSTASCRSRRSWWSSTPRIICSMASVGSRRSARGSARDFVEPRTCGPQMNHERRSHCFCRQNAGRQGAERHAAQRRGPTRWRALVIARGARRARRASIPAEIDDVILGCAMPEAEQGLNVARIASLRAGHSGRRPRR